MWFPRLASERVLRNQAVSLADDAPFALTLRQSNTEELYCLNRRAEEMGLQRGMSLANARALCPALQTCPADPAADERFLRLLARWAVRYCPWVGLDGRDGLVLDVTGSSHLLGGEDAMLSDMRLRLARTGLSVQAGLADTRGGAWALARSGGGIAPEGRTLERIGHLPVAALRLTPQDCTGLRRLGVGTIAALNNLPRAPLSRRFGPDVLMRIDQALGRQGEAVSPLPERLRFSVSLTLPEPVGLVDDVMAALERLLERLCAMLRERQRGALSLHLVFRRVDKHSETAELRLAQPMQDAARLKALFEKHVGQVDAGFGIDQMRLEANATAPLPMRQIELTGEAASGKLDELITRLGNRIGLENIQRYLPAESHIPERSFITVPAAYSKPSGNWVRTARRPLRLFPPEPILANGREPPSRFCWRRMRLTMARATGPERIAPEWWREGTLWRSGVRDYWRVDTHQGRRLWMFHTPQNPGWFVQGEFA